LPEKANAYFSPLGELGTGTGKIKFKEIDEEPEGLAQTGGG